MKKIDPLDDLDYDDDGELDVEAFPIPAGLLAAAGIESDEDDVPPDGMEEWATKRRGEKEEINAGRAP